MILRTPALVDDNIYLELTALLICPCVYFNGDLFLASNTDLLVIV